MAYLVTTEIDYDDRTALLVVDVQNDFADPTAASTSRAARASSSVVNAEIEPRPGPPARFVVTPGLASAGHDPHFAKDGGIWPVHCVQTPGAPSCTPSWSVDERIASAGTAASRRLLGVHGRPSPDGATDADRPGRPAAGHGIERVVVLGLANDYCVQGDRARCRRAGVRHHRPGRRRPAGRARAGRRPAGHRRDGRRRGRAHVDRRRERAARTRCGHRPLRADDGGRRYQAQGIDREATFELFVRSLPAERRFLVAAGSDDRRRAGGASVRARRRRLPGRPRDLRRRVPRHSSPTCGSPARWGHARGRGGLRRRADRAGHRPADRGPAGRDVPAQHRRVPDDARVQGGAWPWRRRPALRRLLRPPRPRRRRRAGGGPGRLGQRRRRHVARSPPAGGGASR